MKVIILAGGSGSRLWPLSQVEYPKQFLDFGSGISLLQRTLKRFLNQFVPSDIFLVTTSEYFSLVQKQAAAIHPQLASQILLEPEKKNTGPAIIFALSHLKNEDTVIVSPCDHLLSPEKPLLNALPLAEEYAQKGEIVLFGIRPHKPETGFGYIQIAESENDRIFHAKSFVEKPDYETAKKFLISGDYLWNAGIFVFQVGHFFQKLKTYCPEMLATFSELPSVSLDYALLEKCRENYVIPLDVSWSDIGSWDSVYDFFEKDEDLNVKIGNVTAVDTKNCLIMGGKRLISTIGLDDMLIVETEEALFLGKKGESQRVKALLETLKRR